MTVRTATRPSLTRAFPHVEDITDWRAKQSIRLLWERLAALDERVQANETTQGDLVSAANTTEDRLAQVQQATQAVLVLQQQTTATGGPAAGGGTTVGGPVGGTGGGPGSGAGGGGATASAEYLLGDADLGLPNGRVVTDSATLTWDLGTDDQVQADVDALGVSALGYWSPISNGDPVAPELLFDSNGDCIVGFVPTP